ncbi:B3 domain-containing protein REM1 isoform X2 [Capsella rubella]|uniref:B3 domain-containing protein REM1 isoform X2 n=1 Tax=Capsella rubella TaxID=81985 RepID=UPI000CD5C07A|nr:B3 domain-containing protein REM1 isoform X2 [Capsella rubella]
MADPPRFSLFHQKFLTGDKPLLTLHAEFLMNHMKVSLISDASDKVWKVKLDGGRLADGWEEFTGEHKFRDGDVLVFKHQGDDVFHVSVASGSVSGDIHHASSSHVDTEDTCIADDYVDDDDDDDDDDETNDDDDDDGESKDAADIDDDGDGNRANCFDSGNKKSEDSSSRHSCFITGCVTRYSLNKDRLDLSRKYTVLFGEHQKACEIDVMNEQGRIWTMKLAKNISSGVFYIRAGWEHFCFTNDLKQGDLCKFKLFQNGKKPVLWLCPQEPGNDHKEKRTLDEVSKAKEKKAPSPTVIVKYTPSRDSTGQLSLPVSFTREYGIKKAGDVILLNQDGRKWSSYLQITGLGRGGSEWFYLRKGWREMCEANGVKVNDSFKLELMWNGETPMFKFCSKIDNHEYKGKGNQKTCKKRACETAPQPRNVKKTPRVGVEGQVNKRISSGPLQPQSFSVSDQVASVKQGIVDTLNTVRQCRTELETSEQNLQASLLAIDALGERIWGISKILSNNLI